MSAPEFPQTDGSRRRVVFRENVPRSRPDFAVVIPTRHEAGNVDELHRQLTEALRGRSWELVFVDDSDDETVDALARLAARDPRITVVHREPGERHGGLGGAVLEGWRVTSADLLVVMDADLQHPPTVVLELVDAMASGSSDVAVATRYRGPGSASGLRGPLRRLASVGCRAVVHTLLPCTRGCSDPLGGFFAVHRRVLERADLRPNGYKILLEVLVRCRWEDLQEVPYHFRPRLNGASKSGVQEARRFLIHVRSLRAARTWRRLPTPSSGRPDRSSPDALRVLLFTSEAPPVVSGIATCVGHLERGLRELGHEVHVLSRADFPRLVHRELRLSAFVLAWPALRSRLCHYDVVNVHGPVPTMSDAFLLFARTLPQRHRPAIVYTHHSDLAIPGAAGLCAAYNRASRRLAHLADSIVVSSHDYQAKMRMVPGAPLEVIPWGVDSRWVVARPPRTPGRLRVLFVGQMRPYKGAGVLLDAVEGLPQVQATFIGDGPERPPLELRAATRHVVNARFLGRVSREDLWRAYSEHDVVVLPSLTSAEAYGLVLGEGMVAGCVPVASDLPGVRELAAPSGLLVPPGDVAALRSTLQRLAADPALLDHLADKSRSRAPELSLSAAARRYQDVFRVTVGRVAPDRVGAAVPMRQTAWELLPDDELWWRVEDVAARLRLRRASLSVFDQGPSRTGVRVFTVGGRVLEARSAPVAEYVARLQRPVLIGRRADTDSGLEALLRRPELTSAILVPLAVEGRSRVASLATSTDDDRHLGPEDLQRALQLLGAGDGVPGTRGELHLRGA